MRRALMVCLVSLSLLGINACGDKPLTNTGGTGGGAATGGSGATGGGSAAGGSGATGGGSAAGGSGATGGGTAAGGSGATGGGAATGGSGATGGGSAAIDAGVDAGAPIVSFIAIGDTGKGNTEQNAVGAAMGIWCQSHACDFAVMLGDNFYPSGVSSATDPLWQTAFEQPYATVNIPFYAVLGNHDYGANGTGNDFQRPAGQLAYAQTSTKFKMPATHYRFTVKGVDFFGADTNRSFWTPSNITPDDDPVRSDFATWLAGSTASWKIALGHHPYLSNGPHGNAGSYDNIPFLFANGKGVKSFLDDRVCGKADVYLCGHDHSRQWLQGKCAGTELIVSGGGASTTSLNNRNPTHYQSDVPGFVYIVLDGKRFTGTFVNSAGVVEYTRTFTKP